MPISFRIIFFIALSPLLAACVSFSDRLQFVSSSFSANNDIQSCDITPEMQKNLDQAPGLNPDKIAFLNWNIYKGNGENWQQDLSAYAQDHDLMTIQEAFLDDELAAMLTGYDFDWIMNAAFHLNGTAAGVMTVANSKAIHSCGFKINEPLIRVPKSILVSYYAIESSTKNLLVANIHGINFTFGVDVYHQQLDKLYSAIKHHDGPMIIAGDFNSWSDDRMEQVMLLVDRMSLSAIEYPVNNKTHVFGMAIDHIFYRQLEPLSNRVWQVTSSDHNPISVNFRVKASVL